MSSPSDPGQQIIGINGNGCARMVKERLYRISRKYPCQIHLSLFRWQAPIPKSTGAKFLGTLRFAVLSWKQMRIFSAQR